MISSSSSPALSAHSPSGASSALSPVRTPYPSLRGDSKARARKFPPVPVPPHFSSFSADDENQDHHAELFYLQKQIQTQTPMVIVLEDGEKVEGRIEWYDRYSIKVRGRQKSIIYKSAIKYMYKLIETGQ
ncbi:MAG: RNA chaperone Hfq [Terracidiphilus sp.]|jgi:RNA chaperone Hfq